MFTDRADTIINPFFSGYKKPRPESAVFFARIVTDFLRN